MNYYKTLLATSLIVGGIALNAGAQDFIYEWGYGLGGSGNETGKDVTTDVDGNVFLVSDFQNSFNADPGAGTNLLTTAGGTDIAISKFDSDGNLIWARSIGGAGNEAATALETDQDGNIYVSGTFNGSVDFDPGVNTEIRSSNGAEDLFLLKLDGNGDFLWVYTNGSSLTDAARNIAVNNEGDVYLTGFFRQTIDFDPGLGTANVTAAGSADGFILKLTSLGDFSSIYTISGALDEDIWSVAVDAFDNIYVTGTYQGTVTFDNGGGFQVLTAAGGSDLFAIKINALGGFQWVKSIGSTGVDGGYSVSVDRNNNVLIGGYFSGTTDFDPGIGTDDKTSLGGHDLLVVKLTANGDYIFGASAGGGNDDQVWSIDTDEDNNIYTTGFFRFTADFDPSIDIQDVSVNGGSVFADQFFWKLDKDGNYLFAESAGGTNNDHALSLHIDGQALYTTGYFINNVDNDLTAGTDEVFSAGGSDISFSKHISCNPIHTNDVIVSCDPITWIDGIEYTTDNSTATFVLTNMNGCDSIVHLNFMIKEVIDQTVSSAVSSLCDDGDVTIDLGATQADVFYSLIDQSTMSVVDGPIQGNGGALALDGGSISTTTTYEVLAERNSNNALSFTGNSPTPTFVNLGDSLSEIFKGTNQVTAEAWINTNSTASLQTVVGNYSGVQNTMQMLVRIDNTAGSNKASFWIGTGENPANYTNVVGTTTIQTDTWYHVAGTYDGTDLSIYVNGVLENTVNVTTPIPNVNNDFKIGGGLENGSEYFDGRITAVRIWNVARTETEINDNMDICIAPNSSGLVAMYNMVDGIGSSLLTDESLNGYNGTLTNMDVNTSWDNADMPILACLVCSETMTQTATVIVNESTTGVDVQEHCDSFEWIDGVTYTQSNNMATVVLQNAVGCDSTVTLDLTITETPTATAVDNGDGTFTATGNGTYQWIDCGTGNSIAGATSATFSPTADGDYAVVVTNGDCEDESNCLTYSTVGLSALAGSNFAAYPNPTTGMFTITSDEAMITLVVVKDAAGRVIYQNDNASMNLSVDLTTMENGVYFVSVFGANNAHSTLRIVKQ